MSDRVIQQADLNYIEKNLNILTNRIENVAYDVGVVNNNIKDVYTQLEVFQLEFRTFVENDIKAKELQLAETRIVKIRQELKDRFGYYDEVRRHTTGILQATDLSLIKKETINSCTEELMMKTPGYWLSPCLIAIAAWISDNKELADKAVSEAIKRNDEKTSILFALICRRMGRDDASIQWLERYFSMQDASNMERKMVVMLDGYSNGLFGLDSQGVCSDKIKGWIEELEEMPSFVENQQIQWAKAMEGKIPAASKDGYEYLSRYSQTWNSISNSISRARVYNILDDHFKKIFDSKENIINKLVVQIDEILDSLVENFDNEELPLRRDERLMQLIIDNSGDKKHAKTQFDAEQIALEEHFSFTQLLTNAAMNPQLSNASKSTQKMAIALSKDWIVKAYEDMVANNRMSIPVDIAINIETWSGKTRDGENEVELIDNLRYHTKALEEAEVNNVKINPMSYVAAGLGALLGVLGIFKGSLFFIIIAVACGLWYYNDYRGLGKKKEDIRLKYKKKFEECDLRLKATLAEIVDYRDHIKELDLESDKVLEFMQGVTPEQYVISQGVKGRKVI